MTLMRETSLQRNFKIAVSIEKSSAEPARATNRWAYVHLQHVIPIFLSLTVPGG
jgi:hypothetical protein